MSSTASPGGGGQGTATGGGSRGGEPCSIRKRKGSPIDVKVVNCRPCGECCGHGYIGIPVDLYDRLKVIQGALEGAYPGQYRLFAGLLTCLGMFCVQR